MKIEIRNRFNNDIIFSGEYESFKEAILKNIADLSGANLSGANLYGADLSGADLSGAIIFIYGSRHLMQYNADIKELRIGCHFYQLEYWLIAYNLIGKEEKYSNEQIKEYHNYMKILKEF